MGVGCRGEVDLFFFSLARSLYSEKVRKLQEVYGDMKLVEHLKTLW